MRVDGRFWILQIATVGTIPWFFHAHRCKDRQALGATAGGPDWQVAVLEDLFGPTPRRSLNLAPIFEIARHEGAKGPRFGGAKFLIKTIQPNLLSLQRSLTSAGFG